MTEASSTHVVVVGGGFAGVGCARELAGHDDVRVTLLDRNDYHQFQPLLYQVATSKLARSDVAYSLQALFRDDANVEVVVGDVESVDPSSKTATTADGRSFSGDVLVLAAGSRARFFHTPGAEEHSFPLYTVDDATRLRGRILELFQEAHGNPSLIDRGALNFVVVGAGATGTEVAGALADLIQRTMTVEYSEELAKRARIVMIEHGAAVLGPFSEGAHEYAAGVLERNGVELRMETGVSEVAEDRVVLSDGTEIATRCVIWGGGIAAAPLAGECGLPVGAGGRIDVRPDLTVEGFPDVYALGDMANIAGADGRPLPQLGSVALQSGRSAAKNIRAAAKGKERTPFHYKDKGIMAMIGRNAAVAEVGKQRHEVHGKPAFLMWVGVHAALLTGVRTRMDAFMEWSWDYFAPTHEWEALDRSETSRIDWGDAPGGENNERETDG